MNLENKYVAIDLGATSGRVTVATDDGKFDEVHRFDSYLMNENDHATWDIMKIWDNILIGLKKAVDKYKKLTSLSIDSWGVDYVLMNKDQPVLPVYSYRDQRTSWSINEITKVISYADLYKITGTQNNQINTIYQLMWDKKERRLDNITDFLFIPEYLTYRLTGKKVHEYTMASTSGLLDLKTERYSHELIKRLGLPEHLFCDLVKPGHVVGSLKDDIIKLIGVDIPVIMPATHDTASAFYAIEADYDSVVISSGTWSLVGVRIPKGHISDLGAQYNFTNSGSVDFMCYLKNVMGLWIFNEVKKHHNYTYDQIDKLANESTYNEVFNVNHPSLLSTTDMVNVIKSLLPENKQPQTDGDIYRTIFRSLATAYKDVAEQLEKVLNHKYTKICIAGGGANNKALNKFTQEIAKREVVAIPIEATIIGNVKVQRMANEKGHNL